MARRGSYAKGVAKRDEILRTALDIVAREGYRGASVKEIADAVGLSQAGLLHYFDSKEELFTEILRVRDLVDSEMFGFRPDAVDIADLRESYLQVVSHNARVPGLVQLFARLSLDAADPAHPAHAFFAERDRSLRESFSASIALAQEQGRITDRVDAQTLARVLQAVSDGLQVQWLVDPDVDMTATVRALFDALEPRAPDEHAGGVEPPRQTTGAPAEEPAARDRAASRPGDVPALVDVGTPAPAVPPTAGAAPADTPASAPAAAPAGTREEPADARHT